MKQARHKYQVSFVQGTRQFAIFVEFDCLTDRITDIAPLMSKWRGQSYYRFITWVSKMFTEVTVCNLNVNQQRRMNV